MQDLAQAASAHHHHHHHFQASSSDTSSGSSDSGSDGTAGTAADSGLSQFLTAFQANTDQNQALPAGNHCENTVFGQQDGIQLVAEFGEQAGFRRVLIGAPQQHRSTKKADLWPAGPDKIRFAGEKAARRMSP